MATLYYTARSCGASCFIAQHVAGLNLKTEEVDLAEHKVVSSGEDFYKINPKGNVPALVLPGGVVLNEGSAVLQYIADQAPDSKLAPANGTVERYQLQNELNFIASDLHAAAFGPLFNSALASTPEAREAAVKRLHTKIEYVDSKLLAGGKKFLLFDHFTIADAYLYIVLSWASYVKVDFSQFANVTAYAAAIKALPKVQEAQAKMAELAKK